MSISSNTIEEVTLHCQRLEGIRLILRSWSLSESRSDQLGLWEWTLSRHLWLGRAYLFPPRPSLLSACTCWHFLSDDKSWLSPWPSASVIPVLSVMPTWPRAWGPQHPGWKQFTPPNTHRWDLASGLPENAVQISASFFGVMSGSREHPTPAECPILH